MRRVRLDELVRDVLCAVGGAVVDDDEFPVDVAGGGRTRLAVRAGERRGMI